MLRVSHAHSASGSTHGAGVNRRAFMAAAGLGGLASVLAACSSGTAASSLSSAAASAGSGLTIGLSYTPNVQFAPFYMAAAQDYYASSTTLRHHGAQEGLFDALLAGTEQLVVAGADEAVVAASSGSDLVIVGGYYQSYPGRIIVPESSSIRSLADLAGHSIGLPGKYGESWFTLQVAMDTAGLDESDLTIQEIGYTQQAALVAGKVDAIVGFSNNDAIQIADAGTPVRALDPADSVPLIGASLVTTSATLQAARSALSKAVSASAQGMEAFSKDPDGAVDATKQYVSDLVDAGQAAQAKKVAVATAALVTGKTIGGVSVDEVASMIDFLSTHGLLTGKAPEAAQVCQPLL